MSAVDGRRRDLVRCEDMRVYAERALRFLGGRRLEEFLGDVMAQDAVIRCVEVIGEAARLVSDDTRRRAPAIPWPLITACGTSWRTTTGPWTWRRCTRS